VKKSWLGWIVDRFGLMPIYEETLNRPIPKTPWYYGDGATLLLLLGVQIVTGALMTLTYVPSIDQAYQSVLYITNEQSFGWFIRGLHYWSAGLMVVMTVFHLFRHILLGGYKAPREGSWLVGVVLFVFILVMSVTGYILRWDLTGVHAARVALMFFELIPFIGEPLVVFVQGGVEIGAQTLTRIYSVHVVFGPMLIVGLVAFHVFLVIFHGVTAPGEWIANISTAKEQRALYKKEKESEEAGEKFFPTTVVHSGMMAFVVFIVALGLTIFLGPAELKQEANLVHPGYPREEWWLAWVSGVAAVLPPWLAPIVYFLVPAVSLLLLILMPFIDRGPNRGMKRRPIAVVTVIVLVLFLIFFSDYRRRSPFEPDFAGQPPEIPQGLLLTADAERGRQLFAEYGCTTCHGVSGSGPKIGPDLSRPRRRLSRAEIRDFIKSPPEGAAMPAYEGYLTGEDLERVVEFCHVVQTFRRE
jgi:ubiquinol-cytochrome c reductase cytochrome b subunit